MDSDVQRTRHRSCCTVGCRQGAEETLHRLDTGGGSESDATHVDPFPLPLLIIIPPPLAVPSPLSPSPPALSLYIYIYPPLYLVYHVARSPTPASAPSSISRPPIGDPAPAPLADPRFHTSASARSPGDPARQGGSPKP